MRKLHCILVLGFFLASCDSPEQNSTPDNTADSVTVKDTMGDTRGEKGTGVDNTGGTPGPGTLTDTAKGKTNTLDHTSKKGN